ncbi:MAG TPA: dTMP kinase [Methanocorpusculum sp.]|nr:dTMP kinase [Methanocorpusculum sp.]
MLVTLEGIDGAGKTTLYKGLQGKLTDLRPLFTREPGSPYIGDAVRRAISKNNDPLVEAALFVADHAVHLATVVRPALEAGKLIISDRYTDSRYAYQQISLKGFHPDPKSWLTAVHEGWTIVPDLTFLLLISPEAALLRVSGRGGTEHFEQVGFLEEVQKNYLERVTEDPSRFVLVDASQNPETILDFVEKSIRDRVLQ